MKRLFLRIFFTVFLLVVLTLMTYLVTQVPIPIMFFMLAWAGLFIGWGIGMIWFFDHDF